MQFQASGRAKANDRVHWRIQKREA